MYILAKYTIRKDFGCPDGNPRGYYIYGDVRDFLWNLNTNKYVSVWRRQACRLCNSDMKVLCSHHTGGYTTEACMTTVLALCELTEETLETLKSLKLKTGTHNLSFDIFPNLKKGREILNEIKYWAVLQMMSRNSVDWNSQCVPPKVKVEDSEDYTSMDYRAKPPPQLP